MGEAEIRSAIDGLRLRADRNAHGHIGYALRLQLLDNIATLITAIGGVIVLVAGSMLLVAGAQHALEVVAAVAGGVITLIGIWQAIWRPGDRSRRHREWSSRYAAVEDACRLALIGNGGQTLETLMAKSNAIFAEADLVPERQWRRFRTDQPAKA
jgi:hypothetical protein